MNVQMLEQQYEQARTFAYAQLNKFTAAAKAESRELGPAERSAIERAKAEAVDLKARLDQARSDQVAIAAIEDLTRGRQVNRPTHRAPAGGWAAMMSGGDLGAQFINSETFEWLQKTKHTRPQAWHSPSSELHATTLTSDSASGGDLIIADYQPGILALPTRRLVMADLFASAPTNSNAVAYMKETAYTNAANTVAEGTTKPESALVFDAESAPVRKIAHWVPVTDEMLEDVPALRGYINSRLRLGVQLEEDDQLLNGTTTLPDIVGILNRTGLAAAQARGTDTNADAIAKQIAAIATATELPPDGIVMHPTNWLTIQLTKDTNGQYYGQGPFAAPQRPTLWGLPVALTTAIAVNTALVGSFRGAAQLFRHGGIRVDVSNSHSDYFIKNLLAIRAEERLALAVYRPAAFGVVSGLN